MTLTQWGPPFCLSRGALPPQGLGPKQLPQPPSALLVGGGECEVKVSVSHGKACSR